MRMRICDAAANLNLSSEALVSILKSLGYPARGYTAYIEPEEYKAVAEKLRKEKSFYKKSLKSKGAPKKEATRSAVVEEKIEESIKQTIRKLEKREIKHRVKKTKPTSPVQTETKKVKVSPYMSVAELAHTFAVPSADVIKKCLEIGLLATVNQRLDLDTIMLLADEFGVSVEVESEELLEPGEEKVQGEEKPRPPVVVVMGHVDHGKTALLDYIRKTKVAQTEYGGITQHTGAYVVNYKNSKITFLDTPGHEAFTAMRARGARVTDIAILVVAGDEGVMPQTIEALNHARAAGVPVIVCITKMDKPQANPERVKAQLAQHNLNVEGYGGTTLCVETSAYTGQGIEELLDAIFLTSLELNLKARYEGRAKGIVLETRVSKGRGNLATVLIQEGTLRRGDVFVCGCEYGRVRDLLSENFVRLQEATPSIPVQIVGFSGLPEPGDRFDVVSDERTAREIAQRRFMAKRDRLLSAPKLTLESLQKRIMEGKVKELKVILKADVWGSAEALKEALEGLSLDEVRVRIIHFGVGSITVSDVLLAQASEAIVVGFHCEPLAEAEQLADQVGVEIRTYRIIYSAIDDIRAAMLGLLEPEKREKIIGKAVVRQVFVIPRVGTIAGCYVQEGKIERDAMARVFRQGEEIFVGKIISLKRFKQDVKEVEAGYECGVGIANLTDVQPEDILEVYKIEEVARAPQRITNRD
ncbi:MAG: translation initiation factor IF-2 [candidate division WOR-3 bacterium]